MAPGRSARLFTGPKQWKTQKKIQHSRQMRIESNYKQHEPFIKNV